MRLPLASVPPPEAIDSQASSIHRVVLVTRRTRLEELVSRFNSTPQAKFYIEHAGGDFRDYELEHEAYRRSLDTLVDALDDPTFGYQFQVIDRKYVPTFLFAGDDLIVTLGQDGLVANTAKYVGGRPVVGVNPDPTRYDGVLLPFLPTEARRAVAGILNETGRLAPVTLASADLGDTQRLLAFNDLFIGTRSHVSARYRLLWNGKEEKQSSSGIVVSTGAGSTGWLSSIFNMLVGVADWSGTQAPSARRMAWDSPELMFVVREPFASRHSQVGLVADIIGEGQQLVIESLMPGEGVIFSDGMENDFLRFQAGARVTIEAAAERAHLVVNTNRRS